MIKFTYSDFSHGKQKLGKKIGKGLLLSLTLLLLGFFNTVSAQTTIPANFFDGNPVDWANFQTTYPIHSYTFDVANATTATDDNYQSAKDVNEILASPPSPQDWTWWLKAANDKGDITNAGAALIVGTGTNHTFLRFFGDRTDNSGACNIGFWFLKNDVAKVGTTAGKFSAGHQAGDVLVLVALEKGGTLAAPEVFVWSGTALVKNMTATNASKAGANQATFPKPAGFTDYTNKDGDHQYLKNAFFEGAIDLTAAGLGTCFATFIVETRQSPSTSAALEDFAAGDFNATPDTPQATVDPPTCTVATGTVNVTNPISGYTYTLKGPSPATTTVNSTTGVFSNVAPGTYALTATQGNCTSGPRSVVVPPKPANPDRPVVTLQEATICGTLTAPTITVSCPINGTYTLTQNGVSGSQQKTYPADAPIVFTVQAGKKFSITVTNTDGCTSAATDCDNYTTNSCPQSANRISTATVVLPAAESKVIAAPNPFNDRIRFSLQSAVSGQGSLELYNMLGQKVKTVFQGRVEAGQVQNVEYSVPGSQRHNLIYLFRVGDQKVSGKLIGLK